MTDLEMTKLCAEAMELQWSSPKGEVIVKTHDSMDWWGVYDPLHDDAQAMALVKRFKLHLVYDDQGSVWHCVTNREGFYGRCAGLNRAIVECVAKMRAAGSDTRPQPQERAGAE